VEVDEVLEDPGFIAPGENNLIERKMETKRMLRVTTPLSPLTASCQSPLQSAPLELNYET